MVKLDRKLGYVGNLHNLRIKARDTESPANKVGSNYSVQSKFFSLLKLRMYITRAKRVHKTSEATQQPEHVT